MIKDFKNLTELQRQLYRNLYKKSFYEFAKEFWNEADPKPYVDGILVEFYCEFFQYLCRKWIPYDLPTKDIILPEKNDNIDIIDVRQDKHNGNINIPPRHSKSMILNVLAGCWVWINAPIKLASISHTQGLAGEMNMKRQSVINSEKFKYFFPEITLKTNTNFSLKDDRGGELYSLNRNALTGYGFDIGICDDLTNAETARKDKEEMNNAWSFFQNTLPSRVNDVSNYVILNIQQRLAPNDITGHIMSNKKLRDIYISVVLPAIFEKETYLVFPISGKVHKFQKGDFLWPERFNDYELLKAQVGETVFQTQYLQRAIATDRTVIREEMIHEIDFIDAPRIEQADMIYASHDFPVKDKDTSDFLGSILAYRVGANLYILDCLEKRLAFVKSVNYVKQLDTLYPGIIQVIEDKANGSPILQQLQDEVPGMQPFQPGTQSKTQRLESASVYMNSSNVYFVKSEFNKFTQTYSLRESLENLKLRLLNFPFVEHDDIVDAFSMMLLYVFMDKRYAVYGRAFNDHNIIDVSTLNNIKYSTVFINKEGDTWKALEISPQYNAQTNIIIKKEIQFKATIDEAMIKLKDTFNKKVFIDCSPNEAIVGVSSREAHFERYEITDYDKSVAQLTLAFSKKRVLIDRSCTLTRGDIETFKFSKSKDENVKYATEKDGFVACIRMALHYYGGIV